MALARYAVLVNEKLVCESDLKSTVQEQYEKELCGIVTRDVDKELIEFQDRQDKIFLRITKEQGSL